MLVTPHSGKEHKQESLAKEIYLANYKTVNTKQYLVFVKAKNQTLN